MRPLSIFALALAALAAAPLACAQDAGSSWNIRPMKTDASLPPLVRHGQEVFQARCNLCHGAYDKDIGPAQGAPMTGTQALEAKYHGAKPALLEQRTDLTPELIRFYVRHGSGVMPFMRKTELGDADLDALVAYLTRKR